MKNIILFVLIIIFISAALLMQGCTNVKKSNSKQLPALCYECIKRGIA